ncbi:MAG TPA: hypothetical protein VFX00_10930 [Pedococcus sp.]|nr:hypothetical protein [Pedococcus sp.]
MIVDVVGLGAWANLTAQSLDARVRTTVLPDDDDTEDEHDWEWLTLAGCATASSAT